MPTILIQMSVRIIKEQELIIGPVAWEEAGKVPGLKILDEKKGDIAFEGDPKVILDKLIAQYARLFGRASNEVCKEAVKDLLASVPKEQLPENLK